ncbi:Probable RNA-directed DNA polymerase from transposon BS [Eumeta japonica]|uniref:Probable RNA-directed DNA polymerase from transposon BS n=1 Tax=Eumeta variegata TaxID=151549 RepID=A0A4C1TTI9_EUMVA|nr:Probable RNA-directed DNA polymerase from transposon BS [Eumeta japonica]
MKANAVFCDVNKAFYRIWHAGLKRKLYTPEVPDRLTCIIRSYIRDRRLTYSYENTHLTKIRIRSGVPQSSTPSSFLYTAYTNDISQPNSRVLLTLFVDDTVLYLRSTRLTYIIPRLQRAIDELTWWFQNWKA